MIINLFCDASIDLTNRIACSGCHVTYQDNTGVHDIGDRMIIQNNATNNSSEILAIWIGVTTALQLRETYYPKAVFRLFSDSKISLYGLRDWLKNWVSNIRPDGTLVSSSGQPVANQQTFIDIYNIIVDTDLRIEFYHQRGHVLDGKVSLDKARVQFIKANKVPPEGLGLDIKYLSTCNQIVDNMSRDALYEYINHGILRDNVELEGIRPVVFDIKKDMLHEYIKCINKTSVKSRHDFKGGYNQ